MKKPDVPVDAANGGVVACVAYRSGEPGRSVPVDDIPAALEKPGELLWIGLKSPTPELLTQVGANLNVGEQALEELLAPHRRPKIIDYGHVVLIVAVTVELEGDRPLFGETQFLIGRDFLLTVRRGASATHTQLRQRLEAAPDLLRRGSDYVAAELLDLMVDRYVQTATTFEAGIEGLEQKLFIRGMKDSDIRRLYRQRRDLLRVHTAIAPLAEICRRLARVEMAEVDAEARPYFSEVADRVVRVTELISALRESLAFAFEASLMLGQSQQNVITRQLAAWAAILAVPTAIAGIYGMNFQFMPELEWAYGYPVVLAVIVTICVVLFRQFKRAGWL